MILYNEKNVATGVINAYTAFAEIYIDDIWVDSDSRGKRYGRKLLQALKDFLNNPVIHAYLERPSVSFTNKHPDLHDSKTKEENTSSDHNGSN